MSEPKDTEVVHRVDSDRNRAMFDKWYKRSLWGSFNNADNPTDEELKKRSQAVLGFMLRNLSRGRIPNPDLVFDTLTGKAPVPACGMIGCFLDDYDHVH